MISFSSRLLPAILGFIVAVGLLVGSIVFLAGVYYLHWEGPVVAAVAKTFPIPAARMGDRSVLLRAYLADVASIRKYLSSAEAERQGEKRDLSPDDREKVLERLIQETALHEIADERNISVTDQQVEAVMEELQVTGTSTEAFTSFLNENYGWTLADFRAHVVDPLILTRLLSESYATDHGGDMTAFERYIMERIQRSDVVRYIKFKKS